jgi:hypothetical protein
MDSTIDNNRDRDIPHSIPISEPITPSKKKVALPNLISRSPTCLSLVEGKIIRFAIHYAQECRHKNRREKGPEPIYFTLKLADLTHWLGIMPNEYVSVFKSLATHLVNWGLLPQFQEPGRTVYFKESPFFSEIEHSKDKSGNQLMTYAFSSHLHVFLTNPNPYRLFDLDTIKKIQSKYTLQLYSFCSSALSPKQKEVYTEFISEEKFREMLGCKDSHLKPKDFHRQVLLPSLDEMEAITETSAEHVYRRHKGTTSYQLIVHPRQSWLQNHQQELQQIQRLRLHPEEEAKFLAHFLPPNQEVHEKEKEFFQALKYQVEEQHRKDNPKDPPWKEWNEWFVVQPCRLTTHKDKAYFVCCRNPQRIHIQAYYRKIIHSLAKSLDITSISFKYYEPKTT